MNDCQITYIQTILQPFSFLQPRLKTAADFHIGCRNYIGCKSLSAKLFWAKFFCANCTIGVPQKAGAAHNQGEFYSNFFATERSDGLIRKYLDRDIKFKLFV